MTRTRRFIGGLSLGYLHTGMLILVGLWLTPYLLRRLGEHEYGLWLLGTQVLVYLALMDLGVVALLPREVAYTTGRASAAQASELQGLVGETARLVLWQTPAVAVVGVLFWALIPAEWAALRWPLALVVAAFVLTFPLRIFHALLQGLQDLSFLGGTVLVSWIAGTVATIWCIEAGFGLYSLAVGWVVTQAVSAGVAWMRLVRRFPHALPASLPSLSALVIRNRVGRGVWVSVSQVAQVLLSGTDVFVVGKFLGPAAVVPYVCTGKLIMLLANQPQQFMQMALPALSELRAGAPRERLFQVSSGMAQAMLIGSGAIVCVVLVANEPFVTWWVGESQFGGLDLTVLLLASMLVRHWNVTAVYTLFCFGYERWLAIIGGLEGLVTVIAMLALVPRLGMKGAVIGSLIGTCAVSLPMNLIVLGREEGVGFAASLKPLRRWAVRFGVLVTTLGAAAAVWTVHGFWGFTTAGAVVGVLYGVVMLPVALAPPLGPMLMHRLPPWLTFVPGLSRRYASVRQ
jgi:O-antigen/teichoic acid export membrane protein